MRLLTVLILLLPVLAQAKEITTITGEWNCEYGARHETDRLKTSAMWFTVTLKPDGTYDGGGKSSAIGITANSRLSGAWDFSEGTLSLKGHTTGPFGKLPFRFEADRQSDDLLAREWTTDQLFQQTRCFR